MKPAARCSYAEAGTTGDGGPGRAGSRAGPATCTRKPEQMGEVHVVSDAPGWPWTRAGTASSLPGPASLWARKASGTRPVCLLGNEAQWLRGSGSGQALLAFRALPLRVSRAPLCVPAFESWTAMSPEPTDHA